ncbi:MAG: redoxin domain-containing protein [Bdellovibrio sp.]
MKKILLTIVGVLLASVAGADAKIGSAAPEFSVQDAQGKTHKLSDYKGKYVILEWYNKDCPYVRKHYDSKNMQKLQTDMTAKGYAWLSVISSAPGKQGHQNAADTLKNAEKEGSKASAILRDEDGKLGKAYGAKTTPHIYLINPEGTLLYNGAIDSNDSADPKTIAKAENYLVRAVASAEKGEKIAKATSKPYGCSVKY